jgi:hypothetical protein
MDGHIDIAGRRGSNIVIVRNGNPRGSLSADNFEQRYEKALHYLFFDDR